MKLVIAKQLGGKNVVSSDGEELGKLVDLYIEESTGKISYLMVDPNSDSVTVRQLKSDDGLGLIPYSAVLAIRDFIIVDRRALGSSGSAPTIFEE